MKIIKAAYEILTPLNGEAILGYLEQCGRTCYKSEIGNSSKFIRNIISRGHESVLEHFNISVRFICDRGISHEIVRHRIASYSQESTRYCNYSDDRFGSELTFIEPCFWGEKQRAYDIWLGQMKLVEKRYFRLLEIGVVPQEARSVLPNSLKTELVMTANLREWRHFFFLRCQIAAHPQMREVTIPLLAEFKSKIPVIFEDIKED